MLVPILEVQIIVLSLHWLSQVKGSIPIKPHPEEVDAVKWVSLDEIDTMMADSGTDYTRADSVEILLDHAESPCMPSTITH